MPEEDKLTYDTEEETEHGAKSRKDRGAIKKLELSFKKTILHKKNEKVIPNNLQHHCFTISTTD